MTTTGIVIDDFCVGDQIEIDHTVTGLLAPIDSAVFNLKVPVGNTVELQTLTVTPTPSANGQVIDPGTQQEDLTYTAELAFVLSGVQTAAWLKPGKYTWYSITVITGGSYYTSEVSAFKPKIGGRLG